MLFIEELEGEDNCDSFELDELRRMDDEEVVVDDVGDEATTAVVNGVTVVVAA